MKPVLKQLKIEEDSSVANILDHVFKRMKREDLIFKRPYEVKNHFNQTRGKWPSAISNSIFLDSKKFHIVYSNLFFKRVPKIMYRSVIENEMS